MPVPSRRLKELIEGNVDHHASQRWPALEEVTIRWRGSYGYLTGYLSEDDDDTIKLCRIQYLGDDNEWAFAIWQASTDSYTDSVLLNGRPAGHPSQALDTACTLYLARTGEQPAEPLKELRGAALAEAIRLGLLEEGHHLDLKREISAGRAANKELARDLASFAVDGGILLVGISEDNETGALSLAPQPLAGLAERIEMVARTIADPPLSVLCSPIRSAQDPSLGYLVVRVPPSSAAPHMVEHRYLGRGDKTKLYLSDADVRRLHERRQATEQDALALLQEQFDRDPIPPEDRKQAHLFLLAQPSAPMPQMLLNLVHGQDAPATLVKFARSVDTPALRELLGSAEGFSPPLSYASDFALRSAGAALTYGLASDRSWAPASRVSPEDVVEVEVDEDGGLRVFMSRLSDSLESADAAASGQRLLTSGAVTYARQFIALTAAAADRANYLGNWILAAGATGIKGIPVHDYLLRGRSGPRQDAPVYQRATSASYAELLKQPGTVADRLIGRLLRATGTYDLYASAVANPPDPR